MVRRAGAAVLNSKGIYNRCKLPRLTVEGDNQNEIEPGGEDITTTSCTIEWEKSRSKRNSKKQSLRPPKRLKRDLNSGPRIEGIFKRKEPGTLQEFNQHCKRLRPSFDPELECDKEVKQENSSMFDMASHQKYKNEFIHISLPTNLKAEATNNIKFGKPTTIQPTQPKPKQKRKSKLKPSYPAEVKKVNTIHNYFETSASPAKTKTKPNLDGGQDQSSSSSTPLKGDPAAQSAVRSEHL